MKRKLSEILSAVLCLILAGSIVIAVLAAIQAASVINVKLSVAWAAAIAVVTPFSFMIGLGVWLVVKLIKELRKHGL